MATIVQGPDPSERLFLELRSKNDEVKNKAATELRDLVTLLSRGQRSEYKLGTELTFRYRMVTGKIQSLLRSRYEPHFQPHSSITRCER